MTYHLILTLPTSLPAACSASLSNLPILPPWYWNRLFPLGNFKSYIPLGRAEPSLVPCPPASKSTATVFSAIAFNPTSLHRCSASGLLRIVAQASSGSGTTSSGDGEGVRDRPIKFVTPSLESRDLVSTGGVDAETALW